MKNEIFDAYHIRHGKDLYEKYKNTNHTTDLIATCLYKNLWEKIEESNSKCREPDFYKNLLVKLETLFVQQNSSDPTFLKDVLLFVVKNREDSSETIKYNNQNMCKPGEKCEGLACPCNWNVKFTFKAVIHVIELAKKVMINLSAGKLENLQIFYQFAQEIINCSDYVFHYHNHNERELLTIYQMYEHFNFLSCLVNFLIFFQRVIGQKLNKFIESFHILNAKRNPNLKAKNHLHPVILLRQKESQILKRKIDSYKTYLLDSFNLASTSINKKLDEIAEKYSKNLSGREFFSDVHFEKLKKLDQDNSLEDMINELDAPIDVKSNTDFWPNFLNRLDLLKFKEFMIFDSF